MSILEFGTTPALAIWLALVLALAGATVALLVLRLRAVAHEATRQILADIPDARILIITLDTDGSALERARAAGALGFLSKQRAGSELEAAIRTVARGHKYPPGSA